jgi:hypothetical protein
MEEAMRRFVLSSIVVFFLPLLAYTGEKGNKHLQITSYNGTQTCISCHKDAAMEVLSSLHYRQFIDEHQEKGGKLPDTGMLLGCSINVNAVMLPNWLDLLEPVVPGKPLVASGCALCHPGLGAKVDPAAAPDPREATNVDCLICHAPNYARVVVRQGGGFGFAPAPGVDLLETARKVGRPTTEACWRCHGVNPIIRRGSMPTRDTDVHAAKGMQCVDCHAFSRHRVAGVADVAAKERSDAPKPTCESCHTAGPHKGSQATDLNRHVARVTCQACHIPAIARDPKYLTLAERDWTRPVLNQDKGLYQPATRMVSAMQPEYHWWNGTARGEAPSPGGRIAPFKRPRYTLIADAATNETVFINLSVYATTGDVGRAASDGARQAGQAYSGQWRGKREDLLLLENHGVAGRDQALRCAACHGPSGLLPFEELGYGSDRAKALAKARSGK